MEAQETSEMINHTRKLPKERFGIIDSKVKEIVKNLGIQSIDIGISLKNKEIDARILRPKPIVYKDEVLTPSNGGWDIKKFYNSPKAPVPCGVIVDEYMKDDLFGEFSRRFMRICSEVNFLVRPPTMLRVVRGETFESVLRKNAKAFAFFLCVLPPKQASILYPKIKQVSYVELGVVTQCVHDDQYTRKGQWWVKIHDIAVLRNIVAGINAKLDQENCIVAEPEMQGILGRIPPSDVMVMGLDVYHGDTSDPTKPSIVALCASKSSHFNRYATALRGQTSLKELVVHEGVDTLSGMVKEVLELRGGSLPKFVFFYRDGVGEGMYDKVMDNEVQTLRNRLAEIYSLQKLEPPKLTFIIAQKRNHFRTLDNTSRDGNPPPGTYVDDLMVVDELNEFNLFNFYLYSHKALAGTARPTHYQVLVDDAGFTQDQIANFTYALTHLHQGCTKSVSIPAPVYYADLACFLAGSCFRQNVAGIQPPIKITPYMI